MTKAELWRIAYNLYRENIWFMVHRYEWPVEWITDKDYPPVDERRS